MRYQQNAILVVDDNEMLRETVSDMALSLRYKVDVAASGEEAVMAANSQEYLAILMDKDMPGIDGLSALARIRGNGKNQATPAIAMTASDDLHTLRSFAQLGVVVLLRKPFRLSELHVSLTSAREQRQAEPKTLGTKVSIDAIDPVDVDQLDDMLGSDRRRDLIETFHLNFIRSLSLLQIAISRSQTRNIEIEAKNLSAMAGQVGAPRLHLICKELAKVSDYRSPRIRSDFLDQIESEYVMVRSTLDAYFGS